jgi:hypothetical protein
MRQLRGGNVHFHLFLKFLKINTHYHCTGTGGKEEAGRGGEERDCEEEDTEEEEEENTEEEERR